MKETISQFNQLSNLLLTSTTLDFKRFLYPQINFKDRLIGLIGPRGVGKTTLILQYLKENDPILKTSLYITADHVSLSKGELFELAKTFHIEEGGRLLCIDEIHRYPNWNQELKNIYDLLPKLKIIFSGSSSINLVRGKYDLSRRASIYELPGLSFREYLAFNNIIDKPVVSLTQILSDHYSISSDLSSQSDIIKLCKDYNSFGYYPFYKELNNLDQYYQRLARIIEKTIFEDISSLFDLKTENLPYFGQILNFLALSTPGEFSVNKVSKLLGKNHETISNYLTMLKDSCLVRTLNSSGKGKSTLKDLKKIFLDNSNLLYTLASRRGHTPELGTIRELFILNQLQNSGHSPFYSEVGDLLLNGNYFEIGGKSKSNKQLGNIKNGYILADDILVSSKNRIPIYLFGFLY